MTLAPDITTVTLVTQTRVLPDRTHDFEAWQRRLNEIVAIFDGFIDQASIRPSPPVQLDWVVLHRFRSSDDARAWMQSPERQRLYGEIQDALVGPLDFHLFNDADPRTPAAPVSAVISTRVTPGQEDAFQQWQRHIAAVEAKYEGYQGYKLEPPIPGVQDDWVMVVRFDNDAHLDAWLNSPERKQLVAESSPFDAETHIRKIQSGFETWFTSPAGKGASPPAAWKMNMVILLVLYPVVFLFGFFVGTPILGRAGVPFWLSLFLSNIFSVVLMGYWLTPAVSRLLTWWLFPDKDARPSNVWAGTAIVLAVYAVSLAIFSRFPPALLK